ncbi:uncharacterized protein LOC143543916 [Bidens hawaiensis]|uniref:uncharacterized protein LOC143543916 n=1 Tax=Bidens hawaiensis TaxID=980011 RepID=UPI004048FDDA
MEIVPSGFLGTLNSSWRRRRYQRVLGGCKSTSKTATLGGRSRRVWKIKAIPRLRLKKVSVFGLWMKLKNAYIDTMLRLAGGTETIFGSKRVPRRLQASGGYSMGDFQSRLIYEISKNLIASRELATK